MLLEVVKLGDKIELIKKLNKKKSQRSLYSKIQNIVSKKEIVISAPVEKGKIIPLELNQEYYIYIYTQKGLYKCEAEVVSRKREGKMFYANLKLTSNMQKHQRREYFRLDFVFPFQFRSKNHYNWLAGTIIDISGGGIKFRSKTQLKADQNIECQISLDLDGEIHELLFPGKIIDSVIFDLNSYIYETRVSFDNISKEDREIIIRFIFEEERKRRKKEKGM